MDCDRNEVNTNKFDPENNGKPRAEPVRGDFSEHLVGLSIADQIGLISRQSAK
jgi:hypothetical protein